jgi:hypothetical protein
MEININDLPKHSNWPHRLLGLSEWKKKDKNASEVLREFNVEKWGSLLNYVKSVKNHLSLKEFEYLVYNDLDESICLINNKLVKKSAYNAFKEQYKIINENISEFLPAKAICELGAGYGQIILRLVDEMKFSNISKIAAEFTSNGVQLIHYLAKSLDQEVIIGNCDLSKRGITDINIPEHGIIFTSFAAMYVPEFSLNFVKDISLFKPSVVIHFEPIFEHCCIETLLGSMQRRYIELNDYNHNLLSVLQNAENQGLISIVKELPQVFGSNPFLPMSIIAWIPIIDELS